MLARRKSRVAVSFMVRVRLTGGRAEGSPRAREIAHFETMQRVQTAGEIAALTALAGGEDLLVLRQFTQTSSQLIQRDVHGAGAVAFGAFISHLIGNAQVFTRLDGNDLRLSSSGAENEGKDATEDVFDHHGVLESKVDGQRGEAK